jgi:multidrug resistance efflux pump
MTRRRTLCALLLLGSILAAAPAKAQAPPTPVVLGQVREGELRTTITAVGVVEARIRTVLAAQVDGRVAEPPLREGHAVESGPKLEDRTVVCRLDRTDRELALLEAEAVLAAARARARKARTGLRPEEIEARRADVQEKQALLDNAEANLARTRDLFEKEITDRSELDRVLSVHLAAKSLLARAEADLKLAEAGFREEEIQEANSEVARQEARVAQIRDELAKTEVRSPVAGVVARRLTEVGQWVQRGGPVAEIVDLSRVRIRTSVTERDVGRLRVGDAATFRADAYSDRTFTGAVSAVIPAAEAGTRTFRVWIDLPNEDGALMEGMFARLEITAGNARRVLLLPKDAVVLTGRGPMVFRADGPVATAVPVVIGEETDDAVVLVKGDLPAGTMVVVVGNERLSPMRPNPIMGAPPGAGPGGGPGGPPGGGPGEGDGGGR